MGEKVSNSHPAPAAAKKKLGHHNLYQVFEAAKKTLAIHSKLCIQLTKIYNKVDFDVFFSEFVDLLKVCLVVGEKHPQVERCLSFVASFTTCDKQVKEDKTAKQGTDHACTDGSPEQPDKANKSSDAQESREAIEEEEDEDVDEFLIKMFQFLVNIHEAQSSAVRYRVCQLINRILNSMGRSASIDDDLFNTIYDTMLERLMDKKPAVRVQAIHALNRLQDPTNKDCPVIKAYRYHLSMDPASEVRRAALCCVCITFQTLPDVLQRTRDKNNLVRRQAYMVLAQKVHVRSLQISQRVRLLSEGLNDRSDVVRAAVEKTLLNSWLRFVDGSVLDLLTCLDVEASTNEAELALAALFRDVPAATLVRAFDLLDANKLIPLEKLKPESALYWKCLVQHLKKEEAEEELDAVLPDLSALCRYTEAFALQPRPHDAADDDHAAALRRLERQFVLQQLLLITASSDMADEVGRRALQEAVRRVLVCRELAEPSIAVLVKTFARLCPVASRVQQLAEIISDIREGSSDGGEEAGAAEAPAPHQPATPRPTRISEDELRALKIKAAKVRVEQNEVREALEECVRSLDLDRAQELKLRLRALQDQHDQLQQDLATPLPTPQASEAAREGGEGSLSAGEHDEQQEGEEEGAPSQEEDAPTLSHCLTIVCEMLRSSDIKTLSPTLLSLHDNLVLPCLKNQDALVREMSVRALGLLCIISADLAQKHLPLFIQILQVDIEVAQIAAVRAVFDVLLIHGELLLPHLDPPSDAHGAVALLAKRLEDEEEVEVRRSVAMGLCKLLCVSRLTCPKLLSQLVLLWYNPLTEEDTHLRQMLGSFFPVYASKGGPHQEALGAAFLRTVRVLVDAPPRSPYADVDIDDVCSFFLSVSSPAIVAGGGQAVNVHDSLVFSMCGEMLAQPTHALTYHLGRALRQLCLTPDNFANLSQVHSVLSKLLKRCRGDRRLTMSVEKFLTTVAELLKRAPAPPQPDPTTAEVSQDLSDAHESTVATDKTADGTLARRKRQLYSNHSSSELLSSEAEPEVGASKSQKVQPATSDGSDQTCLNATVKEDSSWTTTEHKDAATSDQELQIHSSEDRESTDTTERQQQQLVSAERPADKVAIDCAAAEATNAADHHPAAGPAVTSAGDETRLGLSQSREPTTEEEEEEEKEEKEDKEKEETTSTRSSSLAALEEQETPGSAMLASSDARRSLTASRRSRRAALRAPGADTSTDDEVPQPPPSGRRRAATAAVARPAAVHRRSSRGKSLHCAESDSSSTISPPRPAPKKHRGAQAASVKSPSPADLSSPQSSVPSTRSTRSSAAASDASSRRSLRSRNTISPATSSPSTRKR